MSYHELNIEERATIQISRLHGLSQKSIAGLLNRKPSTLNSGNNHVELSP